jgi:RNA-directed DNA polymerase
VGSLIEDERGVVAPSEPQPVDGEKVTKPTGGTPQGSVISPLLANIALDGMEKYLVEKMGKRAATVVRFADDFVAMHRRL